MKWMTVSLLALLSLSTAPASAQSDAAALTAPEREVSYDAEREERQARQAAREGIRGAPHFDDISYTPPPPSFATTLGHAFAGYGLGLLAGGALGTVVGGGLVVPFQTIAPLFAGLGIGSLGIAPFGAALGAWGWGSTGGGTGNFFAALGMSYLGQALGAAWFLAFTYGASEFGLAIVGGVLLSAIASPLLAAFGYDLTMDAPSEADGTMGFIIAPYAAPTETMDGAVLGAMGAF